jgi:hypothetical protein
MPARLMNKLLVSLLLVVVSAALYALSYVEIPLVDRQSEAYFDEALKGATLAYATTRGVNAVVSVLKESEIDITPAGVGVILAAGQILDPIDDMTERLSDVLVMAIVSLGIQRLGYEIGEAISFKAVAVLLLAFIPVIWLNLRTHQMLPRLLLKSCIVLLALRFLLPLSSLINDALYQNVLQGRIEAAKQGLSIISSDYGALSKMQPAEEEGFFSSLGSASDKVEQIRMAWSRIADHAEEVVSSLLMLTTMYLAMFLIQVLLVPLGMLWLLLKLVNYSSPVVMAVRDQDWRRFRESQTTDTGM